jgi:hypothetical protein
MPRAADHDDDDGQPEFIDTNKPGDPHVDQPEDNGNTPDPVAKPAAADADADALTAPAAPPEMIPRARFNEVSEQLAEARREKEQILALAASKGAIAAAPAAPAAPVEPELDVRSTIKARNEALAMGQDDRALELDEKLHAHAIAQATKQARTEIEADQSRRAVQTQAQELARVGAEVKAKYPQLDGTSADKDDDAITFVVATRDRLIESGKSAAQALTEASEKAAKIFGFGAPAPTPPNADPATARTIAARLRNAAAATAQPATLEGVGNRASRQQQDNVEAMSDEQFAALPAAEKKRLRGDF